MTAARSENGAWPEAGSGSETGARAVTPGRPPPLRRRHLLIAGLVTGLLTLPLALLVAPADAVQGQAQRLMYVHVPAAWSAYLCFTVVLLASLWLLIRRRGPARVLARAAAEVGVVLTLLTLATGSLWGAMTWGTWWAWDARIITTMGMGLVYVAYLALDGLVRDGHGGRLLAVVGIVGFATVPVVHFSVLWWRTLHQPPTLLAPSLSPPIHPLMGAALAAAVVTATLLTAWAVLRRRAAHERSADRPGAGAVDADGEHVDAGAGAVAADGEHEVSGTGAATAEAGRARSDDVRHRGFRRGRKALTP